MKKEIIIIAFKFPPMGEVGTRRWAKFAKYLSKNDYIVHVLTIKYKWQDKVNWISDVANDKNIVIHRLPSGYFNLELKYKKNFLQKCFFRLFKLIKNRFFFIDVAQRWGRFLIPYAHNLIQEKNIKNVIVTGTPFSCFYHASLLKSQVLDINLILDYRDPWNSIPSYHLKGSLIKRVKQKEKSCYMEMFSILHADKVFFTTNDLKKKYDSLYREFSSKFFTVYNGFDKDDFYSSKQKNLKKNFNMIYAGNLSFGRVDGLKKIAEAIKDLDDCYINENLKINIYSDQLDLNFFKKDALFETFKRNFFFHSKKPFQEIIKTINQHEFCLSINAPIFPHLIAAKTFDYMGLHKKIFHISTGGELSEILKKQNQYVCSYNLDSIKTTLLKAKNDFLNPEKAKLSSYKEFDLEFLTKKLISFLEE